LLLLVVKQQDGGYETSGSFGFFRAVAWHALLRGRGRSVVKKLFRSIDPLILADGKKIILVRDETKPCKVG
jgi:hypothetical protein